MDKLSVAVLLLASAGLANAAPAKKATLSFGAATASSAADAKAAGPVIKRSAGQLLACYTSALVSAPALKGTVIATFTIGGQGNVTAAAADGVSDEVEGCIAATIAKLKFAKPRLGKPVEISYPLAYEPGDRGALAWFSTIKDAPNGLDDPELAAGVDGNYGFGRKGPPPGRGGIGPGGGGGDDSTASIGPLNVTGALDEALARRQLTGALPRLRDCYARDRARHPMLKGTVMTRFSIGPNGQVASATASGLRDKAIEACVVRAIQAIEFPRPKQGEVVVRVPLTFRPPPGASRGAIATGTAKPVK